MELSGVELKVRWADPEMGPEPEPDDSGGGMSAVVVRANGDGFYLLASGEVDTAARLGIARSIE